MYVDTKKTPIPLDLEELDNYSTPTLIKKETATATSSKPTATPKPNPRSRAPTSKKRKGSDTTAPAPEGSPYEDLSFTDSLEPIASSLHKVISWLYILLTYTDWVYWLENIEPYLSFVLQGLQHLLNLYTESCEATKLMEVKNKKT